MLGKLGSKLVFLKNISSHIHALFSLNSMLWGVSAQNWFFFFNLFFPKFRSIEPIFRSIEIAIKNFGQPLSASINAQLILDHQSKHFRSIEPNFRSIENCIKSFFKTLDSHVFKHFFKKISNTFSLYPIGQGSNQDFFVVFLHSFCKVFLL